MHFRILTYNIHKGIGGLDRRYDLSRIIETIRHYKPDMALLQEVDDGCPRSRFERQVDALADAMEMPHRAYQRNVRLKIGHYGNAVISHFPLHDALDVDLTVPFKKRRAALIAKCRLTVGARSRSIAVVNLHLGLAGFERQMQLRRLLAVEELGRMHADTPLIVAGDFNDVWGNLGRRVMFPAGFQLASGAGRTFPAAAPLRRLDRVFFRGKLEVVGALVGRTAVARRASDHLPLVVDFRVEE